jgi:regulator of protease activity HflC (stomatin/prohibitin superfamily)
MTTTLLFIATAGFLLFSIRKVPDGQAHTVYRLGSYRRTLPSGLHWIVPGLDKIAHRVSLTGRALRFAPVQMTPSLSALRVGGNLYYQVIEASLAQPHADHLDDFVLETAHAALDDLAPWLNELDRQEFNAALKNNMNQRLRIQGLLITRCQLERATSLT